MPLRKREAPISFFAGEACYDLELRDYTWLISPSPRTISPLQRYLDPYASLMAAVTRV